MSKNTRPIAGVAREVRALLHDIFPACFAGKGEPKRPLKIGIHRDIKAALPDLPTWKIHRALNDYVSGLTYLNMLREGAPRVGLDGGVAGAVDQVQADCANSMRMAKLKEIFALPSDQRPPAWRISGALVAKAQRAYANAPSEGVAMHYSPGR